MSTINSLYAENVIALFLGAPSIKKNTSSHILRFRIFHFSFEFSRIQLKLFSIRKLRKPQQLISAKIEFIKNSIILLNPTYSLFSTRNNIC